MVQWIYRRATDIDENDGIEGYYSERFNLWILADRFDITGLMNHVIDILCTKTPPQDEGQCRVPGAESIKLAWSRTADGSPLRIYVLSIFLKHIDRARWALKDETRDLLQGCPEFAADVVKYALGGLMKAGRAGCAHCEDRKYLYAKV